MAKITSVSVLEKFCLELAFDDGVSGTVDLSELVGKGVFALWRDPQFFGKVHIGPFGELVWSDKIDLCPDSLYLRLTGKKPADLFPALHCESIYA